MAKDTESTVVTLCLSKETLRMVEDLCALEKIDRAVLLKELIADSLRDRTICLYDKEKLSASKGAEILGIPLREFLQLLENRYVSINWDSEGIKEYLNQTPKTQKGDRCNMGKLKPKHCPNCGSANIHNQEMGAHSDSSELYDTYCRDCEWSGDISPDKHLSEASPRKTDKKETP